LVRQGLNWWEEDLAMARKLGNEAQLKISEDTEETPAIDPKEGLAGMNKSPGEGSSQRKPSTKAERQEFFLPVSGFVWLYPEEVEVTNHPTFQRLGRVYQLGQTYVIYRGGTHKRLEHCIGTVHVVQRMIEAVQHNSEKSPDLSSLSEAEARFVRLGALLHDIGHMAAGHTLEDELGMADRHDSDNRLRTIFDGNEWKDFRGRTLAALIDSMFDLYVPIDLSQCGIKASTLIRLLIRKPPSKGPDALAPECAKMEKSSFRLNVCRDMIGNTICADLLDYLYRDWYHIGKPRPFDERLLQYMEIRRRPGSPTQNGQASYWTCPHF
jgi:uncharacterized protein